MVEGGVAPHAAGQSALPVDAEGDRRDRRAENIADHRDCAVGEHYDPERRGQGDCRRADRQHEQGRDDECALSMGRVDRCSDRGVHGQTDPAAHHRNQSDTGLAPMLLGDEEDVEVRPQRAAHIGKQEVQRIERVGIEPCRRLCPARGCGSIDYSHSHNVPIIRVIRVSGAPTLK